MKCRFCKEKINKNDSVCPKCGKKDPQPVKDVAARRNAIMVGSVLALTVLAIVLLFALRDGWDFSKSFDWLKPKENDLYYKNSYTVSDKKAANKRDEVVATMGDATLTNGQLQIYYWMQVYDFIANYGDSASSMGFDFTKDLDKQMSPDGKTTWQQYFLGTALKTWQSNQAFALLAEKNGFELTEEAREYLDTLEEEMEKTAKEDGYSSADEMVKAEIGSSCTAEDYVTYVRIYYVAYSYFAQLLDSINPTDEEIKAYFQENIKAFNNAGIYLSNDVYVDLRHIQIVPEGGKLVSNGTVEYPEDAWDASKSEADRILSVWKNGEMTEDSFAELAKTYSQDDSTAKNGGLCSNMVEGKMYDALDKWCFDESRKPGDYAVLKSTYGYHVVYFVEAEKIWYSAAKDALCQSRGQEMVDEVMTEYPMTVAYKEIVLAALELAE